MSRPARYRHEEGREVRYFPRKYTALRLAVGVVWLVLFGMLLHRHYFVKRIDLREVQALKEAREERFMGIYFQGERIGYARSRFSGDAGGLIVMEQDAHMNLNVLDRSYPVTMNIRAVLSDRFLLRNFEFSLDSPFYEMTASGQVSGREVRFTLDTGKERSDHAIRLQEEPYLSTGIRQYLLGQDMKPGDRVKVPYFDPVSLTAKDTIVSYRGKEKVLISGRIQNLHHFVESYSGIVIGIWLDDGGQVIKEESASGFVFLAEPEFQARQVVEKGPEILGSVSVPVRAGFDSVESLQRLSLRFVLPEGTDFDLAGGRQTVKGDIVMINREKLPGGGARPCVDMAGDLAATPYVQSEHPGIRARAVEVAGGIEGGLDRVRALARWVFENVEKRPVLGIPDAVTTLRTMRGDCNEHAALFAALARAIGIPTRIASGIMYHDGAFLYHAWNEVCVEETWISLDTTKNQIPADVGHVRFVTGEVEAQVRIGALVGRLRAEIEGFE